MNYQKLYDALISNAIKKYGQPTGYKRSGKLHTHNEMEKIINVKNNIDEEQFQIHHIIPKCISNDNTSKNLVYLTIKEHKLAHRLLFKIHEYDQYRTKMYAAYLLMYNICKRYDLKDSATYLNKHPVVALDVKTKKIVKSFDSVYDAELFVKRKCVCEALQKRVKTVGGYIWLYREEYENEQMFKNFLNSYVDPIPNGYTNRKEIYHIQLENDIITILHEYNCMEDAVTALSICKSSICNVCKCKAAHANGLLFMYKSDYIDKIKRQNYISKINQLRTKKLQMNANPVIVFDKNYTNIIGYFYSNRIAGEVLKIKSYTNISYVCNGKIKTAVGYGFIYEKDFDAFLNKCDKDKVQHLYEQYNVVRTQ